MEEGARALATAAVDLLDLRGHDGHHPRFGVVDVVPFTPLPVADPRAGAAAPVGDTVDAADSATAARDRFAAWAAAELALPCFLYGPMSAGPERSLPEVRRGAFTELAPDTGPPVPHPTAGACAVGSRGPLIAYNLWVDGGDTALVRALATGVRGPAVRALGFSLAAGTQVSCNLVSPFDVGPAEVHDAVATILGRARPGAVIERCELVGLLPAAVLERIPSRRWGELGLSPSSTVEARLDQRGARPVAAHLRPAVAGTGEPDS